MRFLMASVFFLKILKFKGFQTKNVSSLLPNDFYAYVKRKKSLLKKQYLFECNYFDSV